MNKTQSKTSTRLWILVLYVIILFFTSWMAFGKLTPPLGEKGFWFYIGLLSLLLGSQLVTPFYSPPAASITYAISAVIALLLVNKWGIWESGERCVFLAALIYCSAVALIAFLAILTKDRTGELWQKVSNSSRITSEMLGNSRAIYSFVILFALYVFHRNSLAEVLYVGLAWVI